MCDTFVALGSATADGSVIFGKNSDREPNEAHELCVRPRTQHPPGSTVRLTYIEIPQVSETYTVLLAKPFWIWGAEMGANEHGVVIGNEAVFTRVPYEKGPGLIGMDMIRLALERADTAHAALDTMTQLLEQYGQGGNCGYQSKLYYHNSFILADPHEAWVLETAGRQWAAQRVSGYRSISNALTIGTAWDLASSDLVGFARARGWYDGRSEFDFAHTYTNFSLAPSASFVYTRFSDAVARQSCTTQLLTRRQGRLTVADAMDFLRHHARDEEENWSPGGALFGTDVCMHAGFGPVRINQSVGSMVSHLTAKGHTHWVTGTSAPCTSIFKPVWLDTGLPPVGPPPTGTFDETTLWWRHETLHRATLRDYGSRLPVYQAARDRLELQFRDAATQSADAEERAALSRRCFEEAGMATDEWAAAVHATAVRHKPPFYFARAWQGFDQRAGLRF